MSKLIRYCILTLGFLTVSCQAEVISIRADVWFPINGEPNSSAPGYMIELAQKIAATSGHEVDYKTMPWERSVAQVREGEFDCVVGAYKEDAPDFIYPDTPWGIDESFFYTKKGSSWQFKGISSLDSVKIGSIGGYAYDDALDAYIEANKSTSKVQVINANNALENNIKKVIAGRIDATVESKLVMSAKLKELGLVQDIVPAGRLGTPTEMYIACSPAKASSKNYVKLFTEGTHKLRQSGELKTLLEKYGLEDWQ